MNILETTPKKASKLLKKVLLSAVANAENNYEMDVDKLYVVGALVDEGPRLKRVWPRGWGRASRIIRRMSHITIEVEELRENLKRR